mmetsp:Transcript_67519/g.162059  ORF Transcript_67519/g.162059 Transcript_67519/m.162059 type:complete len:854 (+) Transcript_67519:57-2618(+)
MQARLRPAATPAVAAPLVNEGMAAAAGPVPAVGASTYPPSVRHVEVGVAAPSAWTSQAVSAGAVGLVISFVGTMRRRQVRSQGGRKQTKTHVRASPRRTTSSAPDIKVPTTGLKDWFKERDGIKNPDGWQWVSGRWVTKEESKLQEEKIEKALQEAKLRKAGLSLQLQKRIAEELPSHALFAASDIQDAQSGVMRDMVAEEWAENNLGRFGADLLEVLAHASKAAHIEFGAKAAIFGLITCPSTAKVCSAASSQEIVEAVRTELTQALQASQLKTETPSLEELAPLTPAMREILEAVEAERERLGHEQAEPGHLVLVLTSGRSCVDGLLQPFLAAGINPTAMRPLALQSLGGFLAKAESRGEARVADVIETVSLEAVEERKLLAAEGGAALQGAYELLCRGLVERGVEAKLLLLAALSGEHLFLLGAPGTAKSQLARRLSAICSGAFFERLLTRFSVPEEIFGPLSLQALENDELRRKTNGFLPQADVAFVDEIFKANSSILNTMLMILNERCFDNGDRREQVPLWCVVAASNELPDTDELDALYDRFLLRRCVQRISPDSVAEFLQMTLEVDDWQSTDTSEADAAVPMTAQSGGGMSKKTSEELQARARQVVFPERLLKLMAELREYLANEISPPIIVSDRRLAKAAKLLRVAAAAVGSSRVVEADLWILQHVFWDKHPEQASAISGWLSMRLHEESSSRRSWYFLLDSLKTRLRNDPQGDTLQAVKRDIRNFIDAASSAMEVQLRIARDAPSQQATYSEEEVEQNEVTAPMDRFFWLCEADVLAVASAGAEAQRFAKELGGFLVQAEVLHEIADISDRSERNSQLAELLGVSIDGMASKKKVRRDEWGDEL